jgi:putative membrane protein
VWAWASVARMTTNTWRILSGVALAALLPWTARAASSGAKQAVPSQDQHFVHEAAAGGQMEVELGKLAQQKASSDRVKQFGQRMVQDHSQANDKLQTVAKELPVTLPTSLPPQKQQTVDQLSKLNGSRFDQQYMRTMVKDHTEDVAAFQKEAKSGRNAQVKEFASNTLPTLQEHLTLARQTAAAVGAHTSTGQPEKRHSARR